MKIIIFSLLLFYSGLTSANSLDCPCKVVKILDGDTVHVLDQSRVKHKIRLMGIDSPEKKQPFGKKSKQNLSAMIAGQFIEVEYNKRDWYGRIVGKLLLNGQDINLKQVKQGFAWHYKAYQKEQTKLDRVLYDSAEIEAESMRIGLWSAPAVPPWEFRRAKRKSK
jgi:endonuclease YncB( thermonuclease family)